MRPSRALTSEPAGQLDDSPCFAGDGDLRQRVDALVDRRTELRGEALVALAWVSPCRRGDFGGKQVQQNAIFVCI